ncbi:MAG: hypothetical protein U0O18_00940 [Clostridia bacterium]
MIRIDDERWGEGEFVVNSFPLKKTMVRSDAWNKKTGAHASTLEMELMHEAEKQGAMHHFSSDPARRSPNPAPARQPAGQTKTHPARPIKKAGGCRLTSVP